MLPVVKRDRLPSFGAKTQTDEEEEQKEPGRQSKEEKFHTINHLVKIIDFRINK
jgi:hypothetical protein